MGNGPEVRPEESAIIVTIGANLVHHRLSLSSIPDENDAARREQSRFIEGYESALIDIGRKDLVDMGRSAAEHFTREDDQVVTSVRS